MMRQLCKSKIHRARVTQSNLDYEGSITIDSQLLEAADILPFEKVRIANLTTGARLETYAIKGESGSGVIGMNGAASHLAKVGDEIHIISYGYFHNEDARSLQPQIIHVDKNNQLVELQTTPT